MQCASARREVIGDDWISRDGCRKAFSVTRRLICRGATDFAIGNVQQGLNGSETPTTKGKANMKTTIYLPMAAMLFTAALAVPAARQNQVPFKGSIQGHEIDTPRAALPPPH